MKRTKPPKGRNPVAYALALRGAGKVMKDRRTPRGPSRSAKRDVASALEDEGLELNGFAALDEEEQDLIDHVFGEDECERDLYWD